MFLSCPDCHTKFKIDPAVLGEAGRKVRCAKCAYTWHQMPEVEEVEEEPIEAIPEPEELDIIRPASRPTPEPPTSGGGVLVGWLALTIVVLALGAGGVYLRQSVVEAWPPALRLYQTVGLSVAVPGYGLEFSNISSSQTYEGDVVVLSVSGDITNTSEEVKQIPRVRVGLVNAAGRELYFWTFKALESELGPGLSTKMQGTLKSPPEAAKRLAVTFVDSG